MMTDIEIKDELYNLIKGTSLANEVTGILSKRKRPKNSDKEDIIISVLTNVNGQKQIAYANVNIYVQDQFNENTDQYEESSTRARVLSKMAENLLEVGRINGARFTLTQQRFVEVDGTNEHVINNRLEIVKINE